MEHSSSHLLSVILFTPLAGAPLLLFIPRESPILPPLPFHPGLFLLPRPPAPLLLLFMPRPSECSLPLVVIPCGSLVLLLPLPILLVSPWGLVYLALKPPAPFLPNGGEFNDSADSIP